MNIWQQLPKPILALAPMEDVTDTVFRQVLIKCGKPHIFFTEFTNVEGLSSRGNPVVSQRLKYTQEERPIIAQLWGSNPEHFFEVAKQVVSMGYDGIDINMGCPQKIVVKTGSCAALINNPKLAHEIITATQEGAKSVDPSFAVSVKTRIGYETVRTAEWISFLLSHHLEAVTIHGRTAKEMSRVPAHWDEIGKAVTLRNKISPSTILLGNGDVTSYKEALEKVSLYNVDGVMIGRGIFKNPYIFNESLHRDTIPLNQLLHLLKYHLTLWEETWGENKHYPILKKYYKIYISGFEGASEMRERFMNTQSPQEAHLLLSSLGIF